MARGQSRPKSSRRSGCVSKNQLRLYALIATLIVAGLSAAFKLDDGNLWNFLEIVATVILVQMDKS